MNKIDVFFNFLSLAFVNSYERTKFRYYLDKKESKLLRFKVENEKIDFFPKNEVIGFSKNQIEYYQEISNLIVGGELNEDRFQIIPSLTSEEKRTTWYKFFDNLSESTKNKIAEEREKEQNIEYLNHSLSIEERKKLIPYSEAMELDRLRALYLSKFIRKFMTEFGIDEENTEVMW